MTVSLPNLPDVAFNSGIGVDGIVVVMMGVLLRPTVPRPRSGMKWFLVKISVIVVAMLLTLAVSIFLARYYRQLS